MSNFLEVEFEPHWLQVVRRLVRKKSSQKSSIGMKPYESKFHKAMAERKGWRSLRSLAIFKIFVNSFHSLTKITKIVEPNQSFYTTLTFHHKKGPTSFEVSPFL